VSGTSPDDVKAEVLARAEASEFVERLAERVGGTARAAAIFGEPVEREGLTVIPVARAAWGFGGGSGGDDANQGAGGGGGSLTYPLGYIEVRRDGAEFKPLRDRRLAAAVAAAVGLGLILLRKQR
jgi:uncharacterized spore protein YtfJ